MKLLSLIIVCLFGGVGLAQMNPATVNLKEYNLKGKVQSVKQTEWMMRDGVKLQKKNNGFIGKGSNYFAKFNTHGDMTSAIWYDTLGEVDSEWGFEYDNNYNLEEFNSYEFPIERKELYVVDSAKEEVVMYVLSDGFIWSTTTFKFDRYGRRVNLSWKGKDSVGLIQYEYEKEGDNLLKEVTISLRNGEELSRTVDWYDEEGHLVKNAHIMGGMEYTSSYTYEGENLMQVVVLENEEEVVQLNYEYDKHNNIVLFTYIDQNESPEGGHTIEYKYDRHKNWVSRKIKSGNDVIFLAEREFSYFD